MSCLIHKLVFSLSLSFSLSPPTPYHLPLSFPPFHPQKTSCFASNMPGSFSFRVFTGAPLTELKYLAIIQPLQMLLLPRGCPSLTSPLILFYFPSSAYQ